MPGLTGLTQTAVAALFTGASEPVLESKWHQPWSEPVRSRIAPQLAVALIASGLAYVEAAPFAESVTEDRWHQAWSEPVVKARPRLAEAQQQFLAWQPAPSPFVASGWYAPLSEPVRIKPALPASAQQFAAPDPQPRVSFSWFGWLPEPVRLKPRLPEGEHQFLALGPWPAISISWWRPLDEPTRVRPTILIAAPEQQVSPFDEDIVFVDRWFAWWSEPVRVRPALSPASQQVLAFDPQPFPLLGGGGGWYLPARGDFVPRVTPGEPDPTPRKVKKPGAPRQVAPKAEPPTFAEVIGAQQPTRLADVLGSAFALQLAALQPPALDLYQPPAGAAAPAPAPISRAAIDAAADHVDAIDAAEALHALDELDRQEHEAVIAILLHLASSE
jgi:hypothetical protein